ncbi:ornithine cyclodeaminase [Xylariaceae sp. FL0662B]|nr:ornithine cyclodeaminase [Xylariaceae sp. FL0662B]
MSLAVLSDEDIRTILESLTHEEAGDLQNTLRCALHEYSTGTQSVDAGLIHQPDRTLVHSKTTGATTLFMPSHAPAGHGIKVITVPRSSTESSPPANRPTGSVTLYAPNGDPIGFLHAQTLTAFRTALASSILLTKRTTVHTLTVFGAGLQAYWHIRLALMLRGSTIRHVYILNRRFSENAQGIIRKFYGVPTEAKRREGWEHAQFSVLTPGYGDYPRLQKDYIRAADVIYCCTPSTEDLFEAGILTSHDGRRKGRLIVAVGSYTPQMRELPRDLLLQATKVHTGHLHFHKHAVEGGVIIVDTLDGVLKEAGEIIEAGLEPRQLVELGELVMIRKLAMAEQESQLSSQSLAEVDFMDSQLDLAAPGSAMSMVFGPEIGSGNGDGTRTTTPTTSTDGKRSRSHSTDSSRPNSSGSSLSLPQDQSQHRPSSRQGSRSESGSATTGERLKPQAQHQHQQDSRDDHLARWLSTGNVVYKSVGLGLMDLVVGLEVVRLAREKGLGSHIDGFSS